MAIKLDMRYVYDFQRERHQFLWDKVLPLKTALAAMKISNCYALPPKHDKSRLWGLGGVIDSNDNALSQSFMSRVNQCLFGGGYEFDKSKCKRLEGEYIYLGILNQHWGHFLVDYCTRMYYAIRHSEKKCFFLTSRPGTQEITSQIYRFIELSGINMTNISFISDPVFIEHLIIPEQSYIVDGYYSREYLDVFEQIVYNHKPKCDKYFKKIFFSRTKFNKNYIKEIGSEMIEDVMAEAGFKSICPEEESLDNQIAYLRNCEEFCAINGSLHHNLVFTQNLDIKTYVINKQQFVNNMLMDTYKCVNKIPVFLDFYLSKYPVHIFFGPFLLVYNRYVDLFLEDNKTYLKNKHVYTGRYLQDSINKYNELYNIRYILKRAGGRAVSTDKNHPFFYNYKMLSVWADEYAKYESKIAPAALHPHALISDPACNSLTPELRHLFFSHKLIYDIHFSMEGWTGKLEGDEIAGNPKRKHQIEAIRIYIGDPSRIVYYRVMLDNFTWTPVAINGGMAGTTKQKKKLLGIQIWLGDLALYFQIQYRAHTPTGWTDWHADGEELQALRGMYAFQAKLLPRNAA